MSGRKRIIKQAAIVTAFAKRLKETRHARGLTQSDLATRAQVTPTYITRLEAGRAAPGLDLLERLAQALGVRTTELVPDLEEAKASGTRQQVKEAFDELLQQAGQETLSLLGALLSRLAESPAMRR